MSELHYELLGDNIADNTAYTGYKASSTGRGKRERRVLTSALSTYIWLVIFRCISSSISSSRVAGEERQVRSGDAALRLSDLAENRKNSAGQNKINFI